MKDAELANAKEEGSSQLQSLETARSEVANKLKAAQQQLQVRYQLVCMLD